jgi:hypothetical protein
MGEGFVDAAGIHRYEGEGFVDAAGIHRSPGEGFVDAAGIHRYPGEGFVDAAGIYREPGEGFVDANGIHRSPSRSDSSSYDSADSGSGSSSSSEGGGGSIMGGLFVIGALVAITVGLSPVWYFMSKSAIKKAKSCGQQPGEFVSLVHRASKIPAIIILLFYAVVFGCVIIGGIIGLLIMAGKFPELSQLDWNSINFY